MKIKNFWNNKKISFQLATIILVLGAVTNSSNSMINPDTNAYAATSCPLPSASTIYSSETFNVPDCVSDLVILIPNEAHEPDSALSKHIAPKNLHYLAAHSIISKYTSLTMISDDANHQHATWAKRLDNGIVEWKTQALAESKYSTPAKILGTSGVTYKLLDPNDSDMKGTVMTRATSQAPPGKMVAGLVFVPQKDIVKYRAMFTSNGFAIDSEYNFTWLNTNNVVKSHTVILYHTTQSLSSALITLSKIVAATPYT